MRTLVAFVVLMAAAAALVACNAQEEAEQAAAESAGALPESGVSDASPQSRSPERGAAADSERRQAMEERMEAMRRRSRDRGDAEQRREAMRARAEAGWSSERADRGSERMAARRSPRSKAWWKDAELSDRLGLTDGQMEKLDAAQSNANSTLTDSRSQLVQINNQLGQALESGDRAQLKDLLEKRRTAAVARADAEAQWGGELLEILTDEQLEKLSEERPALVTRVLSPR